MAPAEEAAACLPASDLDHRYVAALLEDADFVAEFSEATLAPSDLSRVRVPPECERLHRAMAEVDSLDVLPQRGFEPSFFRVGSGEDVRYFALWNQRADATEAEEGGLIVQHGVSLLYVFDASFWLLEAYRFG